MDNNNSRGGIGCLTVIQIVLIMLKLFKLIDMSWWLIFIPTYITLGIVLIGILIMIIGVIIAKR